MPPTSLPNPSLNTASPGLSALLERNAFCALDQNGWLEVRGSDRVRWLNGMVTNSIQALSPGEGCYSFVLNAQGRIQGDLMAWLEQDRILLETTRPNSLAAWLERYIIMDDVELSVLSPGADEPDSSTENTPAGSGRQGLLLAGPEAEATLRDVLGINPLPAPLQFLGADCKGAAVQVFHAASPLVARFELWFSDAEACSRCATALASAGVAEATHGDLDQLRLLEGTPLFGIDIRNKDLPQETAQTQALHFAKGCYLGQEIVERIRSRGAVHRTFSGFFVNGELPIAGTPILAQDAPERPVGEFTSSATIALPGGSVSVALGYIRRDVLDRNAALIYGGGTAEPASLPFRLRRLYKPDAQEPASEAAADIAAAPHSTHDLSQL